MSPKLDTSQIVERVEGGEMEVASSSEPEIGEDANIGNVSNSITGTVISFNSGNVNVDQNIVFEILSRLPVKSLMQFKCVSKHWCSMILRDRYFIDLHLKQSKARPCLFTTVPRHRQDYEDYRDEKDDNYFHPIGYYLVTADLLFEGAEMSAVVRNIREMDTRTFRISGSLNGLVCLFDPEKNHSVQVCNLSTREVTPWIKSTFISDLNVEDKGKYSLHTATCYLGFSPATNEHKVICFWNQVCEVLTVGDGKWRKLDDLPQYNYKHHFGYGASLYVNGSIYFYCPHKLPSIDINDKPEFLVAFDVGEEKFRIIRIPSFILDQIPPTYQFIGSVQFVEIDGHPSLLTRLHGRAVRLWLFDDDYKNGCRSNTWKEVTIWLPIYWGDGRSSIKDDYSVHFHSVTGTDFMILYLYRPLGIGDGYYFTREVSQYSYNRKKEIFMEIEINGLPSSIPYQNYVSCISTFAENLSSVQQLANNTQDLGKYVAPDL